jgi:hypothetical protein
MKRGIGFGKIGMNLGSLQIREKDAAAEEKSGPDEGGGGGFGKMDKVGGGGFGKMDKAGGGGFGKMDKGGGGGFGKMDKAGVGAGKIDNLLESEKGAGEEEYRQGKYISRRRRNKNLVVLECCESGSALTKNAGYGSVFGSALKTNADPQHYFLLKLPAKEICSTWCLV